MNYELVEQELRHLAEMPLDERIEQINKLRLLIKSYSPFKNEPIDCVLWIKKEQVTSNDYNPNSVAPPEMQLLECSIEEDGYTQPIVAWKKGDVFEIVDGFHRHRVGKECSDISARIHGHLPLSCINEAKSGKDDRIASTIRHNRARGKHSVDAMTEIVVELKKRNWSKEKIAKHLGMDQDEILRLTQISGLTEMFKDEAFSDSWNIDLNELYSDEVDGLAEVSLEVEEGEYAEED